LHDADRIDLHQRSAMSRYTGPRVKVMRALGLELPGLSRRSIPEARRHPPGQHGARKNRARKSDFGRQLAEKQKLRFNYGLSERQLRAVVTQARRSKKATGAKVLELLERRLDNFVFRAGLAPTIPAARQLIRHRHVRLNGRTVNIPSIRVRAGDVVEPRESSREHPAILDALQNPPLTRPEWISFDEAKRAATVAHLPSEGNAPFPVELNQVVEYYATRL
jgi:small subunit ribosomal protein S4